VAQKYYCIRRVAELLRAQGIYGLPLRLRSKNCATLDLSRDLHMDKSKPPILPDEFRLRSASGRTSADIDAAPPRLANSRERAAVEPQSRSGQVQPCRNDPSEPSVAVYYRNEGEVSEGFFIALRAMGVAIAEPIPGPPESALSVTAPPPESP